MAESRMIRQLRRDALGQDALLFSAAFSIGALGYLLVESVRRAADDDRGADFWSVTLSGNLILVGLVVGELFLVWNNGWRQGVRGHSIGKHRVGLAVVDVGSGRPTGPVRGLLRGLVMALLLDLAAASIPVGLPTVLRRLTPESWHVGAVAYVALLALVIPLLLPVDRGFPDRVARTEVVQGTGPDAVTTERRTRWVSAIEVAGVAGLVAVALAYIVFFAQLMRFPHVL
jgi:hypothetical protein